MIDKIDMILQLMENRDRMKGQHRLALPFFQASDNGQNRSNQLDLSCNSTRLSPSDQDLIKEFFELHCATLSYFLEMPTLFTLDLISLFQEYVLNQIDWTVLSDAQRTVCWIYLTTVSNNASTKYRGVCRLSLDVSEISNDDYTKICFRFPNLNHLSVQNNHLCKRLELPRFTGTLTVIARNLTYIDIEPSVRLSLDSLSSIIAFITKSAQETSQSNGAIRCIEVLHNMGLLNKKTLLNHGWREGDWKNICVPGANIPWADFSDMDLSGANLQGCSLLYANLSNTKLAGTNLLGVRWRRCMTLEGHNDPVFRVSYSPQGDKLATLSIRMTLRRGPNDIRMWSVATGQCLNSLGEIRASVYSLAYSPKGDQIATGNVDNTIQLYSGVNWQNLKVLAEHTAPVNTLAYSPEGDQLASGSADQTICLWSVDDGRCLNVLKGHTGSIQAVAYSPRENQLASGSDDCTIRVWSSVSGQVLKILCGHTEPVTSITYSLKDNQLASGSYDGAIRLWSVKNGHCIKVLKGQIDKIYSIAYAPEGDRLASGGNNNRILLWSVESGQCLIYLEGHTLPVFSVAYSPCGNQLASGSWDETCRLWDLRNLPVATGPESIGINLTSAKGCDLINAIGVSPKITKVLKSVGAMGSPSRLAINVRQYGFFGDHNGRIPMTVMCMILKYLPRNDFHLVVPLVCRLWRDAAWALIDNQNMTEFKF